MEEPLENLYFNWLCAKVTGPDSRNYSDLYRILFSTEFIWIVPGDRHRIGDCLELREDFLREAHLEISNEDEPWLVQPACIFELFLSFSFRASFQTGDPSREWFYQFLVNLKLDEYRHVSPQDVPVIQDILHIFVNRLYDPRGYGGMFPIPDTQNDQTDIEIWYQFSEYLEYRELV